ncbi:hypothetical protein BZJ18_04810 [Salinivibrio sp. IB872]|nr:hypothetical protein BZJ18_04810 [Salinivibrio sp. IB872]
MGRPASQGYERRTATGQRCRALGIVPLSWYIARGQLKIKAEPALYSELTITQNAQLTTVRKRTTLDCVMATAAHRGHTFSSQPLPQSWGALLRKAIDVAPQLRCRAATIKCQVRYA